MGKNFGLMKDSKGLPIKGPDGKPVVDKNADVTNLPNGAGYQWLQKAFFKIIDSLRKLTTTVVLVCHVKNKTIQKDGADLDTIDIQLTGKIATLVPAMADGIGLCYRKGNNTILSFKNDSDNYVAASRCEYLREKEFVIGSSDDKGVLTWNTNEVFPENL